MTTPLPSLGTLNTFTTGENGWGPGMNVNLRTVDDLVQIAVIATQSAPPGSPADGSRYVVGAAPTGAWDGQTGKIARYVTASASWTFYSPKAGWEVFSIADGAVLRYDGAAWQLLPNSAAVQTALNSFIAALADPSDPAEGAYGLVANAVARVETVTALRALPAPTRKTVVYLEGYDAAGDGGGGALVWMPTSNKADNGCTVFMPNSAPANGRWERGNAGVVDIVMCGAKGDGVTPGQQASFALALNAVPEGGVIDLPPGTYLWSASVLVSKKVTVRSRGATIKFDPAYNVSGGTLEAFSVSGNDVLFEGIDFDATGAPAPSNNSRFIWSTAARTTVRGCRAKNLPGGTANVQVAFGSSISSSEFSVYFCSFDSCPGAAFAQGPRPVFAYNRVIEPKDVSFALNSANCVGGQVFANNIRNAASTVSGHILAEEGASDWLIQGNYVYGVKDGIGIGAVSPSFVTVVEGGQIIDNIIDGGGLSTTNPSALISVSIYYRNTQIENNKLRGMPSGLASNAAIGAPMAGTMIRNNRINATAGTASANAILLNVAGGNCYLVDNEIDCTTGPSRHVVVSAGNNAGGKLALRGGRYLGGAEGVNFNLNAPTNIELWIENITEITAASPMAVSTAYPAFGDRQTYFNTYGAARWPHSIKGSRTVMYGNAAPTSGAWQQGDEVIQSSPLAGVPDRFRCIADGTPGVWKAGASLAA